MKRLLIILLMLLGCGCSQQPVRAQYIRFHGGTGLPAQFWWDVSSDPAAEKYTVKCGPSTGSYNQSQDVALGACGTTACAVKDSIMTLTAGSTYYCAVTVTVDGTESDPSNEITFTK